MLRVTLNNDLTPEICSPLSLYFLSSATVGSAVLVYLSSIFQCNNVSSTDVITSSSASRFSCFDVIVNTNNWYGSPNVNNVPVFLAEKRRDIQTWLMSTYTISNSFFFVAKCTFEALSAVISWQCYLSGKILNYLCGRKLGSSWVVWRQVGWSGIEETGFV